MVSEVVGKAPLHPPSRVTEHPAAPLGLLSLLPRRILRMVVSAVKDKAPLRASCRGLRLAVHSCASSLTWSGPDDPLGAGLVFVTLQLALPAPAPMALGHLGCSGCRDRPLRIHSLAGCPPTLHTLICAHTLVAELGPLAACPLLQTLNCSNTRVSELGPLTACTSLQVLDCWHTLLEELGPLAVCTLLLTLVCSHTRVSEVGPLAACTSQDPRLL